MKSNNNNPSDSPLSGKQEKSKVTVKRHPKSTNDQPKIKERKEKKENNNIPKDQIQDIVDLVKSLPPRPPPPYGNVISQPRPQKSSFQYIDENPDDSDEEEDEEDDSYEEDATTTFTWLETRKSWLLYFYREKCVGSLPTSLCKILLPYCQTNNSLSFLKYESLLKDHEDVVRYSQYCMQGRADLDHLTFIRNYYGYWYSNLDQKANILEVILKANSTYMEQVRDAKKHNGKNTTQEQFKTYWALIMQVMPFITAAMKLIAIYKLLKEIWPYISQLIGFVKSIYTTIKKNRIFAAIIPSHPVLSAVLEEIIKIIPGAWRIIAFIDRLHNGNYKTWNWHKNSMNNTFGARLAEHIKYNTSGDTLKEQYSNYVLTLPDNPQFDTIVEPMKQGTLPSAPLPKLAKGKTYNRTEFATVQEHTHIHRQDFSESAPIYPLMFGISAMVRPGNTYENQVAAIDQRISNRKNSTITTRARTHLKMYCKEVISQIVPHRIENWLETLRPEQKRNVIEWKERMHEYEIDKPFIKCIIKLDELSPAKIPRVIANLSGLEFAQMGKVTTEIAHGLADIWNHKAEGIINGLIPYFTHGASSHKVALFFKSLREKQANGGTFLGDDTLVIFKKNNTRYWLENDFSGFDTTQCNELRQILNEAFGTRWPELLKFRTQMMKRKYKMYTNIKHTNKKLPPMVDLEGEPRQMRPSGEAATCLDNSILNAIITSVAVDYYVRLNIPFERTFEEFGLISKVKIIPFLEDLKIVPTFLKCAIFTHENMILVIRQPSFILKFGKVLTEPKSIIKTGSQNTICRKLLYSQWLGYGYMKNNWFFSRFSMIVSKLGMPHKDKLRNLKEFTVYDWQMKLDNKVYLPDDMWDNFMFDRYGISHEESEDFLSTISTIKPEQIPVIYHHPLLSKLEWDYR